MVVTNQILPAYPEAVTQTQIGPETQQRSGPLSFPSEGNNMGYGIAMRGNMPRKQIMKAMGSVVYAARLSDGVIKFGWTEHFGDRLRYLSSYTGQDVELLAFRFGDYDDEQALHGSLAEHRAGGSEYANAREYYEPTPEVMAVVNSMRGSLNMPHVAA